MASEHEPTLDDLLDELLASAPPSRDWDWKQKHQKARAAIIDRDARIRAELEAGIHESIAEAQRGYVARLAEMIKKSDALIAKAEAERDAAIAERDGNHEQIDEMGIQLEKAEAERDQAIEERDAATVEIAKRIDAAIDAEIERDALAEKLQNIDSAIVSADENRHSALKAAAHLKAERDQAIAERDALQRDLLRLEKRAEDWCNTLTRVEAERDQAIARAERAEALFRQCSGVDIDNLLTMSEAWQRRAEKAEAERDAAIARAERAEAMLRSIAHRNKYCPNCGRFNCAPACKLEEIIAIAPEKAESALATAPDRTVPDGWALVPVEPTNAMVDALYGPIDERPYGPFAQMHYAEMLAAAPPPPDVER